MLSDLRIDFEQQERERERETRLDNPAKPAAKPSSSLRNHWPGRARVAPHHIHLHLEIIGKRACRHRTKEAHFPDGHPTHQRPAPARVDIARLLPDDKHGRRQPGPLVRISSRACSTTAGIPTRVPSSMPSTTGSTSMSISAARRAQCLCRHLRRSRTI